MKRLLKLIRTNNLDFRIEYYAGTNQYKISVSHDRLHLNFMIDAFDVSRSYSNRELEDLIVDYICSNFRLDKEDEY